MSVGSGGQLQRWSGSWEVHIGPGETSVVPDPGGKYNGVGAYITSAQIIPDYVNVLWGFDFTATMKLGGIQNGGKRTNPVAQATLLLEHSVSNILKATSKVNAYVIDGNGGFSKY